MKRHSEKGMALVITLMMLAIVTFMAVIFLSLSRRERSNVKLSEDQNNARLMSDAALARAQADMTATMVNTAENFLGGATNSPQFGFATNQQHIAIANGAVQRALFQYDLRSSRNYLYPIGYDAAQGLAGVNYWNKDGTLVAPLWNWKQPSSDFIKVVASLQYDPRPPVIVSSKPRGSNVETNDFRFYIDLNRNGMYDTNGVVPVTDSFNDRYSAPFGLMTNTGPFLTAKFTGDPEWIGVLEKPDQPHSELNRFVGRYAYIALPMGKSLDINYIHNLSFYNGSTTDLHSGTDQRFARHQGVGSWELNMGAFLVDFHTNVWNPYRTVLPRAYQLTTNISSGTAFNDAAGLLQYRLNSSRTNLLTAREYFGTTNRWAVDLVDMMGDGPYIPYQTWYYSAKPMVQFGFAKLDDDLDTRYWHGAEHINTTAEYPDVQRFFKLNLGTPRQDELSFYTRFTSAVSNNKTNTYDRYAYYRWLAQMGTDSRPALENRVHLNFTNEPGALSTNLVPWVAAEGPARIQRPPTIVKWNRRANRLALPGDVDGDVELQSRLNNLTNFFLIAAEAMLKASLYTNVYLDNFNRWRTNYTVGGSYFQNPSLNARPDLPRAIANVPVRPEISVTNIQIYCDPKQPQQWRQPDITRTNAEYTAALHRILQVAANIYDSMTNRTVNGASLDDPYLPTVFRPIYDVTQTNISIVGWVPQTNATDVINASITNTITGLSAFRTMSGWFTNRDLKIDEVYFYGQPWVIGVKKGWPNFNEFSIETFVQVTRKLEMSKPTKSQPINTNDFNQVFNQTRQIYMLGISNTFGIEAWNSYTNTLNRRIRIDAEVLSDIGIVRTNRANPALSVQVPLPFAMAHTRFLTNAYIVPSWPGDKRDRELGDSMPQNGDSDFRVPIYRIATTLTNSEYSFAQNSFFMKPALFQSLAETPDLIVMITNRMRYLAVALANSGLESAVIDYVTLDGLVTAIPLDDILHHKRTASDLLAGAGLNPNIFWDSTPMPKSAGVATNLTVGDFNQIAASLDSLHLSETDWKNYSFFARNEGEIKVFQDFIAGQTTNTTILTNTVRQAPYAPTRVFKWDNRFQANDPFVHYTVSDLIDPFAVTTPQIIAPNTTNKNDELGKINTKRQSIRAKFGVAFQDAGLPNSDAWQFPISKISDGTDRYGIANFNYRFPNIGTLGQIHRGTPWQTIYLKAAAANNLSTNQQALSGYAAQSEWSLWSGSFGTHPTNDWRLVGLFTTAMSENAARGLLGVNQANTAAWSAVLSGVPVITNSVKDTDYRVSKTLIPQQFGDPKNGFADLMIEPGSTQLSNIVRNINDYRSTRPMGLFSYMGEVLGAPMLSIGNNLRTGLTQGSPYLNLSADQFKGGAFTDEAFEAIPQRILSLLKDDEPRVVIYCFGQTLKPAPRSLTTTADYYNLCVNYQVTGEYVTKAIVRVEGELKNPANPLRTVVESFEVLPPFD